MEDQSLREQIRMVFNHIDKDQSGTLSIKEIEEGLKMLNLGYDIDPHVIALEIFTESKTNLNDSITYESFLE